MIKLIRERTKDAIPAPLRGKGRLDKQLKLLRGRCDEGFKFTSRNNYWKCAKKQLKRETHGKCAYCEAPTDIVAHGDVEHFRPKSVYWWLAYCYDNYLYSCQICNEVYKGDHFPVHGERMQLDPPLPNPLPRGLSDETFLTIAAGLAPDPLYDGDSYPMTKFLQTALREQPGLIDPYTVDPEPFFKWVADPVLKEVYIRPRHKTVSARRAYEATEKYLGLNRVELLRVRWTIYQIAETLKDALQSNRLEAPLRDKINAQLRCMMSGNAPFAGMVRYFVKDEWKLPLG
jgi:hypothetical protein